MECHLTATWAELLQFKTIWSIATILGCNVITFLTLCASHRDARTDISAFRHFLCTPLLLILVPGSPAIRSGRETRTLDLTIMSRTL